MTNLIALKQCTGCNKPRPLDDFRHVRGKPLPRCRECISTYQKERRANVGETRTGTHRTWDTMKQRCNNPNHRAYKDYGGRGITVCAAWLKFENFLADMGERPEGKTLDRVNNNDGYHKENCRWSTTHEQAANRRMSKTNKTGVTGVWYSRSTKRWQAQAMIEGVRHHLYQGPSKKLALQARKDFDANQVERNKARDSGVCHYCRRPFAEPTP